MLTLNNCTKLELKKKKKKKTGIKIKLEKTVQATQIIDTTCTQNSGSEVKSNLRIGRITELKVV